MCEPLSLYQSLSTPIESQKKLTDGHPLRHRDSHILFHLDIQEGDVTMHEAIVQLRKQKCGDLRRDHSLGSFAERGKMRNSIHDSVVKSEVLETSSFEFLGCP